MENATPSVPTVAAETPLILPRKLAVQLLHHAQCSPEAEVCGLVAGYEGRPECFVPIKNVAEEPQRQFEMDEAELLQTMKLLRERNHALCAIFHSHPSAPAEPSARDLAESAYPEALHLIASLNIKGVLELRAWMRSGEEVLERSLGVRD